MARSLAFGVTVAAALLWLTFFAGPGSVEFATLAVTAVALWWFATVDPGRLVDERGRPQGMLFVLSVVGCALLVTAAALIATTTTFLILAVGLAAIVTGLVRAVRHGMAAR
ncbi:MAG TPA: hypothetical protein VHL52_02200 [Acidimicrobiia bacterium]|nr:hypothetical protein [Acidimicrobiia bacterium]